MSLMDHNGWRIDDLAQKAGLPVDTIRYYQREGLLPPAQRAGRCKMYGPVHLTRLERIRELQQRRFSLAAIRALIDDAGSTGLRAVFTDAGGAKEYSLDEMAELAGVDGTIISAICKAGLLREPRQYGRATYDGDDLEMLHAVAALWNLGLPVKAIAAIARIYTEGVEQMQRRVMDVFGGSNEVEWDPGEYEQVYELARASAGILLDATRRIVDYTHHRTLQRLTLDALAEDQAESGRRA